jgi:hypothetical protein
MTIKCLEKVRQIIKLVRSINGMIFNPNARIVHSIEEELVCAENH